MSSWSDICRDKNGGMKCDSADACRWCKDEAARIADEHTERGTCDNCGADVTQNVHGEIWHVRPNAEKLRASLEAAENRAYRLAIAICGGEDVPGYVDSVPMAALTDMLREERRCRDAEADTLRAEVAQLKAQAAVMDAWLAGEPSEPPRTGRDKSPVTESQP